MSFRTGIEFLLLAAVWGASFLCMRIAAPDLGPVPVALLRCAIGAAVLLAIVLALGKHHNLKRRFGDLTVVGIINSAVPFALLAYASLSLLSGTTSIVNSLAPLWAAIVAFVWLGDRLTGLQALGLALGVIGVAVLATASAPSAASAVSSAPSHTLALAAAVAATAAYGVGANYTRQKLADVDPLVVAAGSQVGASLALLFPGLALWPESTPSTATLWLAILVLGLVCTGFAYLLFFRIVASAGATKAVAVTFVIPVFGLLWGAVFLDETIQARTVLGAAIIVAGTALTTLARPRKA